MKLDTAIYYSIKGLGILGGGVVIALMIFSIICAASIA